MPKKKVARKKRKKSAKKPIVVKPQIPTVSKARISAAKIRRAELKAGLPFLFGWGWYSWAKAFFDSKNKINLLCAANQVSKSSTQIRKCIQWATKQSLWPELWAHRPQQFWYLYPTGNQSKIEFETKWQQFLPQGKFKTDPIYGWRVEYKHKELFAIHFNSGVHVYFKTYAQSLQSLQTGTVDALFCDEELPIDIYDELIFRISACDGYFHMVFTATLGQDFWRRAMEPEDGDEEALPDAFKQTVSMYECLEYIDGTKSHWTLQKIAVIEARCKSHAEVQKRVHGRFILEAGRKFPQFDRKKHMKDWHMIPKSWHVYSGSDIGSGNEPGKKGGHKSAITFVAVSPDFRQGRVFLGWRGDDVKTTSGDVIEKHIEMCKENKLTPTAQYYDWAAADFATISTRMGQAFMPADKGEKGYDVVNVLFKNGMLFIYKTPELQKLASELSTLKTTTAKNKAKDDFADSFRYAVSKIPWDWSVIIGEKPEGFVEPEEKLTTAQFNARERRQSRRRIMRQQQEEDDLDAEIEEINEMYGN